jgi:CRP-like cAMP-binding protein
MALTGRVPDWMPEDVFSPRRLTMTAPIFMSRRDSLWRIASSLCKQLAAVNRRISDALSLHTGPVDDVRVRRSQMMMAVAKSEPAAAMPPALLKSLPLFKAFTGAELDSMQRVMRRWEVRKGTLLFAEGSAGGSCFIIVKGEVEVSLEVHGRHQLLARLGAGSVFGQVSLISGEPRSATCTISRDAVLVELERADCEALLDARSSLSLKLLGVLNDGIIAALRAADRRIMKLDSGDSALLESDLPAQLEEPAGAADAKERVRSRARIVRADVAEA